MWPDFGEINCASYKDITFTRFSVSSSDVTLTFDLLTQKPNQYVSGPRYICDLILVKLKIAPVVTKILYSPGFSGHCLLLPGTLTFDPRICTSTNPNTSVTKIRWNSIHWFLRYNAHKVIRIHRLTDPLTEGHTWKQNASRTEGFQWWRPVWFSFWFIF